MEKERRPTEEPWIKIEVDEVGGSNLPEKSTDMYEILGKNGNSLLVNAYSLHYHFNEGHITHFRKQRR